jgi:hypothetical protein
MNLRTNPDNGILDDDEVLKGDINETCIEASRRVYEEELAEDDLDQKAFDDGVSLACRAYEKDTFDR